MMMTYLSGRGRIGTIFSTQEAALRYADAEDGVVLRFLGWDSASPWAEPGYVVALRAGLPYLGSYPMIEEVR